MTTESAIITLPAIVKAAERYNLGAKDFLYTLRATGVVPSEATDADMVACIMVAHEHALNPLTREIYFMKAKSGHIQPIVSVDGWIKKCNEHPQFDGIDFKDTVDGQGALISVACSIYRKDRTRPTTVTEYMSECLRKSTKPTPWDSHPNRMLRHKALIQSARIAFGFAGIMDPDEFAHWQDGMKDITPKQAAPELPDIPDVVDIPDVPDDVNQDVDEGEINAADFLKQIAARLKDGYSPTDIYETFGEMAERLPEDARGKFDQMLEAAE